MLCDIINTNILVLGAITMVIDFHTHIFVDQLAERAISFLEEKGNIKAYLDGTLSSLLVSMDNAGIDISIVQPVVTKPSQTETVNSWAAEIRSERIIPFAGLHPDDADYKQHIIQIREMGFKGIKMHPDYQSFFVDEPRMFKIYDAIFENGLMLMLHAGLDVGFPPPYHCTPPRLANVLDTIKDGEFIAAHLGGHAMWDEVEDYLVGRNLCFDTSMGIEFYGVKRLERIVKAHGSDKLLFGSDSPWSSQSEELNRMKNISISQADLDNILYKTASKKLGL